MSSIATAAPAAASGQATDDLGGNGAVEAVVAADVAGAVAAGSAVGRPTRLIVDVADGELSAAALDAAGVRTVAVLDELGQVVVDAPSGAALQALAGLDGVEAIAADRLLFPSLNEAKAVIGQPSAAGAGATGAGQVVAVLDTGITPAAFGCTAPGDTCAVSSAGEVSVTAPPVTGYSTVGSADGAYDDDPNQHGTRVAMSVLAAAPAARIAFIDVFARYTCTGATCPYGAVALMSSDSMLAAGLNQALQLRNAGVNIRVVNISAGSATSYAPGACASGLGPTFNVVRSAGILPVVAAGNEGKVDGISSPACLTAAFAVGSTYDAAGSPRTCKGWTMPMVADGVTCFSNSSSDVDLLAPGSRLVILSAVVEGTSFSAPLVAGGAAALWSVQPAAALDTIATVLAASGPAVTDTRNGVVKRRLDLPGALASMQGLLSPTGPSSGFVPVTPVRALDTRPAPFGPIGVSGGPVGTAARSFSVADALGLAPGQVAAVALNLTGISPAAPCYLTVWPNDGGRPFSSNLNLLPGQTLANSVIVGVGADGRVGIGASCDAVDVAADVTGWFPPDADVYTVTPTRVVDTRIGLGAPAAPIGSTLLVASLGQAGLPADPAMVDSVLVNVTVDAPSEPAYLTIWPSGTAKPFTSSLNFGAAETATNFHIAKVGPDGTFAVAPSSGATHLIVDVFGWVPRNAAAYRGVDPVRILDTRDGFGVCASGCGSPGAGDVVRFAVTNLAGVPGDARAVALKVTAASATAATYVTLYPSGMPTPNASNLFVTPGKVIPNLVTAKVGLGGAVDLYNAAGTTAVVVDVVGYYP
ncbi:MAG: S8/S53 family peptidase [Acidimicrobiales bacterium]|nr:S8/S53 family peptidase [Acidimicrobiales bacterium]